MKPSTKTYVAELFALKSTTLLGAAIDAHGVGIILRGTGMKTGMTIKTAEIQVKKMLHYDKNYGIVQIK